MRQPAITAILNAHREGMLALASLKSLERAAARAEAAGLAVEILAVLDRPDPITRAVIESRIRKDARLIETDFGDPGLARNRAVAEANGTYIAFLDADDLWGADWLEKAAGAAAARADPVIWHPEVCLYFGAERHLLLHVDMEGGGFRPARLMIENCWTMLSFGRRELYRDNPYPDTDLEAGFGFEDWGWNMHTISRGIVHKIVPGTGHVIRRKSQSVSRATVRAGAVPRPSPYIRQFLGKEV